MNLRISKENIVLLGFILLSLVISLLPIHYGYFRDEFYYIALSKHLAFGYVDVPPLLPWLLAFVRFLFGESLFAIHIIPSLAGVATLIITREIVKKLGGQLFAQFLTLLCLSLAPVFIATHALVLYDCLDQLFWVLCLYALVSLLTGGNKKYWLYFGIFAGLGLMSKFTMLWLGCGVIIAMLLTSERKYFVAWQFWLGGFIALLVVTPYLVWIAQHQFLTLEYFRNYANETAHLSIWGFLWMQILKMNPVAFPIWALGLGYFLFNKVGRKFILFGLTYIVIFALCLISQSKFYVIIPFYPVLFAGGAVLVERFLPKLGKLYMVLIAIAGLLMLPLVRPIFPVATQIKYLNYTHLFRAKQQSATEKLKLGVLPQIFADCFGWEEMTVEIAKIYYALPPKQRDSTFILAGNYGEASAIYFYGKKYNLPMPISTHLQYYVWGYRNANMNSTMIAVGCTLDSLKATFKEIKQVGRIYNKYAVPYENQPIYLCRGFKKSVAEVWAHGKSMHM